MQILISLHSNWC